MRFAALTHDISRRGETVSPEDAMAAMRGRLRGDREALAAMERRMITCVGLLNKYKKVYNIDLMYV
ncbi:MAG: hypothetical protein LBD49_01130 [Oscillospiraceae bacterium]|nr:hypothetical protein [Oscillospiraceae bacterium]